MSSSPSPVTCTSHKTLPGAAVTCEVRNSIASPSPTISQSWYSLAPSGFTRKARTSRRDKSTGFVSSIRHKNSSRQSTSPCTARIVTSFSTHACSVACFVTMISSPF